MQTGEAELRRRQQAQRSRFFIRFAIVEAIVLVLAVVAVFVLELIDPDMGIWVLIALAALGSVILSGYLVSTTQRDRRELEALRRH